MRSRIAAVLVGGAFLLVGAQLAMARSHHRFSGEVSQLDSMAKTLVVKEGATSGREMTFTLASDAKVMQGAKAMNLSELKVGERVKVTYADEGSNHQASRVEVLAANTAQAAPLKPAGTKPKSSN